jgi:AcrR family transcriptional regulator
MNAFSVKRKLSSAPKRAYRLGARAVAQAENRRRILASAEAIFHEHGFEAARMRDIAERAGVATGTLFLYAPDKRSLLLLILHEHLVRCVEHAFSTLDPAATLLDQVVHVYREQYLYLGADARLSLRAVQEAASFPGADERLSASEVAGYLHRRVDIRKRLSELVLHHQQLGAIDPAVDPEDITEVTSAIYQREVRMWLHAAELLQTTPNVRNGVERLRKRLAFALSGALRSNQHANAG